MSTIRLHGSTSGHYDVTVPAVAGTNSIDLSNLATTNTANTFNNVIAVQNGGFDSRLRLQNTGAGGTTFDIYSTMNSFAQGSETLLVNYGGSPNNVPNGLMKIKSNGCINLPYQPVSQIACTNAGLTTNGNRYEGTANVNIGNGWSNSSNTFTAPIAGTYLVNFSGWTNYTTSYGYMAIYKNGSNYYTWHYNHGGYQIHTFASGMLYVPLAQNDTIDFRRGGAGSGTYAGMYFNISLFG